MGGARPPHVNLVVLGRHGKVADRRSTARKAGHIGSKRDIRVADCRLCCTGRTPRPYGKRRSKLLSRGTHDALPLDMDIFSPAELPIALAAARAVNPRPSAEKDELLRAVALLHGAALEPDKLPQPKLGETARAFRAPLRRKRLITLAMAMAVSDGEVERGPMSNVALLARAFGTKDEELKVLRSRAIHQHLLARVDFTRRMAARMYGGRWPAATRTGAAERPVLAWNLGTQPTIAARYHSLARLHPMSFGFALWQHYRANHFPVPGDGGLSERLLFHDLGHVLSGYDIDPQGELQQASFRAGTADSGCSALYAGILQYQAGPKIAPLLVERHELDVTKVELAYARGTTVCVDLSEPWDFWPLLPLSLTEARRRLGVPPLRRAAA